MGSNYSNVNHFFWPQKGELQLWIYEQSKLEDWIQSQSSLQNVSSVDSFQTRYSLGWITKGKEILFNITSKDNMFKCRFIVESATARLQKFDIDQNNSSNSFNPAIMWRSWVEVWRTQQQGKSNLIQFNTIDELQIPNQDHFDIGNPTVIFKRKRVNSIQFVSREVSYIQRNRDLKGAQYQVNQRQSIKQLYIFNWDPKVEINPDVYIQDFINSTNSETQSIQNTN